MTPEENLKSLVDTLGIELNIEKIDTQQVQQIAGKPGAFVSAFFLRESMRWQRMQAMVEVSPRSYLVLVYDGPAEAAAQSESMFQLVVSSLAVLSRKMNEDELKAVIARKCREEPLPPGLLARIEECFGAVELDEAGLQGPPSD